MKTASEIMKNDQLVVVKLSALIGISEDQDVIDFYSEIIDDITQIESESEEKDIEVQELSAEVSELEEQINSTNNKEMCAEIKEQVDVFGKDLCEVVTEMLRDEGYYLETPCK